MTLQEKVYVITCHTNDHLFIATQCESKLLKAKKVPIFLLLTPSRFEFLKIEKFILRLAFLVNCHIM